MKCRLSPVAAASALVCLAAGVLADPAQRVLLTPETPTVDVAPRSPGRQFFDLPALEYSFDVETRCDDDWVPESLSLNVADSRVTFAAGQLSGDGARRIVINVPARQLAPVAIHDFCLLAEDPAAAPDGTPPAAPPPHSLTVRAVLSAQASLLCRSEQERRITYVSLPLDVTLSCQSPPKAAGG